MSVYVDRLIRYPRRCIKPAARRFGREWCHLTADTEEELHEFAERVGLRREWFQPKPRPHYDLTPEKRLQAVRLGAVEKRLKRQEMRGERCRSFARSRS